MSRRLRPLGIALAFASLLALPTLVEAQKRGGGAGKGQGPRIGVGGRIGQGVGIRGRGIGMRGVGGMRGRGNGLREGRNEYTASMKVEVKPNDGVVYVDRVRAGLVDDFDGWFQRLHLMPGTHEITVRREGYNDIRQSVYVSPGSNPSLKLTMKPGREGPEPTPPAVTPSKRGRGGR